jgi:hypothetical protein
MALFFDLSAGSSALEKCVTRADIVSETTFRQWTFRRLPNSLALIDLP